MSKKEMEAKIRELEARLALVELKVEMKVVIQYVPYPAYDEGPVYPQYPTYEYPKVICGGAQT